MRNALLVALACLILISSVFSINYLQAIYKVGDIVQEVNDSLSNLPGIPDTVARRTFPFKVLVNGALGTYQNIDIADDILLKFLPPWLKNNNVSCIAKISPYTYTFNIVNKIKINHVVAENVPIIKYKSNLEGLLLRLNFYFNDSGDIQSFSRDVLLFPTENENGQKILNLCVPDLLYKTCYVGNGYGGFIDTWDNIRKNNNIIKGNEIDPVWGFDFRLTSFKQTQTTVQDFYLNIFNLKLHNILNSGGRGGV